MYYKLVLRSINKPKKTHKNTNECSRLSCGNVLIFSNLFSTQPSGVVHFSYELRKVAYENKIDGENVENLGLRRNEGA